MAGVHAVARTGREPAPARDPHAAPRRAPALCREHWRCFDDERLLHTRELAQAYVEVRLFQLHNWRSLSRLERGREPGPEGSILKLYWSEMSKRLHALALDVLGAAAPLWHDAEGNPGQGSWQRAWLYYQAASIFAGTNEIQHNVIGERVLGLPNGARKPNERRPK